MKNSAIHDPLFRQAVEAIRYQGTPQDWADYLQREDGVGEGMKGKFREIESYLRSRV